MKMSILVGGVVLDGVRFDVVEDAFLSPFLSFDEMRGCFLVIMGVVNCHDSRFQ